MGAFQRQGYGCISENNSLLVVPPGTTRKSLGYCGACTAARCVFLPGMERVPVVVRRESCDHSKKKRKKGYQRAAARKRAKGLTSNNKPLKRSCWNCEKVCRLDGTGFICSLEPDDPPLSAAAMRNKNHRVRAEKCETFGWRLVVDIPEWEGEDGTGDGDD